MLNVILEFKNVENITFIVWGLTFIVKLIIDTICFCISIIVFEVCIRSFLWTSLLFMSSKAWCSLTLGFDAKTMCTLILSSLFDLALQNSFTMQQEKERAMINEMVAKLTTVCWDKCITSTPGSKFSSSEQSCLSNCARRYLDMSALIMKRFQNMQWTSRRLWYAQFHFLICPNSFGRSVFWGPLWWVKQLTYFCNFEAYYFPWNHLYWDVSFTLPALRSINSRIFHAHFESGGFL